MEVRRAIRDAIASGRSLYGRPCVDAATLFAIIDTGGRVDGSSAKQTPDGSISEAELAQAMVRLGIALQPEQLHALLTSVDADKDGLIGRTEFLRWLGDNPAEAEAELRRVESQRKAILAEMEHERQVAADADQTERAAASARAQAKERARVASRNKAFAEADVDGSGELDVRELRRLLHSSGIRTTGAGFEKILATVDVDGDGKISRAEFERVSTRLKSIAEQAEDAAAKDARKAAQLQYTRNQTERDLGEQKRRSTATRQVAHNTQDGIIAELQPGHHPDADGGPQLDRKPWLPIDSPALEEPSALDAADEELQRAENRRRAAEADMRRILADDEAADMREHMTEAVQTFLTNPIYTRYGTKARALVGRCEKLAHHTGAHPYQLLFEGLGRLAEEEGANLAANQMREKWAVAGRFRRAKAELRESRLELEYAKSDHRKAQALERQTQLAGVRMPRSVAKHAVVDIVDRAVDARRKGSTRDIFAAVELRSVAKQVIDDVPTPRNEPFFSCHLSNSHSRKRSSFSHHCDEANRRSRYWKVWR